MVKRKKITPLEISDFNKTLEIAYPKKIPEELERQIAETKKKAKVKVAVPVVPQIEEEEYPMVPDLAIELMKYTKIDDWFQMEKVVDLVSQILEPYEGLEEPWKWPRHEILVPLLGTGQYVRLNQAMKCGQSKDL
jgi:hypothetical protein